ncbi:PREDICTED: U-box domain-containing protein 44-like [Nelumbo nucifera]|uniref:RING-type E3 ubiquitin transferase n=1 Tax=Nelumbo nucifera TaxID=4432 RepID=A0A1U7ZPH5_NELNU|nr:PREDICTED: U-box domain-containing protein 44-like [Nelumbo nucifera]
MTLNAGFPAPALESIRHSLSEICVPDQSYSWENPRRFSGYANRLQLLLNQFTRSSPENCSASVQTALKGISGDLKKAAETLSVYRNKSKIFVLINCHTLCTSLEECTIAIGGWLALLDSVLLDNPDLRKKVADLSSEMRQPQFRVTENEERVYLTLEKEGQGRQTSKAVQSAIIMDLARALGTDPGNHAELAEQIKLLKNDLVRSNSVSERRILMSLERIFDSWSVEPKIVATNLDFDTEEDAHIPPFKNFICPLTKEAMKDPVVLESLQTYERTAIEYWFQRCIEDGRDPTCPVTGQVLKSLEQKPNIGLAGAIEEWVTRNIDIHIKSTVQHLSEDSLPSPECIHQILDNIYKISEEHPSSRYRIRDAGVVVLIINMLKNSSKNIGSQLRTKALMTLLSMAKDEDSKLKMLEEGVTRLAIHGLIGSSDKEREYAVKLLLDFSSDEDYCAKIASEKGALVLLSSMAGNLEHPSLSNLAEEILKRMEKIEDNVHQLAAAGRFQPLLTRLCEGTDEVRIDMASILGRMTLTNSGKELIARQGAKILVDMLSKPEARKPSLQALYNLSTLDDNATILVDSAVLPALTDILLKNLDAPSDVKELSASIISNIVSNPGHWELASADREGNLMQSEVIIHNLLGLLSDASPKCQIAVLQILYGIATSPQASESVARCIESIDGIRTIIQHLEHQETDHRISSFRLTRILSERLDQVLVTVLRESNKLPLFKNKLLDNQCSDGERSEAACILANIPLSDDEVKTILEISLVGWIVTALREHRHSSFRRTSRPTSSMVEGLVGLLLHFSKSPDPTIMSMVQEHRLMTIFCEQLSFPSNSRVKQRAACGLKYLSEYGRVQAASRDSEPQPPNGFCSFLTFMCGRATMVPTTCPIHNVPCEDDSQFCLLKGNCIKLLVDLLTDQDTSVQIAAVEALSTLVFCDTSHGLKRAIDELEELGVIDAVIDLFTEVRPGELQEKAILIVDRVLRVDSHAQRHSCNQTLVRALVEAFKHGNANTKRYAQDALTNLKQLSGISGKNSNQSRGWRLHTEP